MKRQTIFAIKQRYHQLFTIQNVGLAVAIAISLSWTWGAVVTLQKNYTYQRQIDENNQKIELAKLQNKNYQYQQAYYKSGEYLELSARSDLGLALPGEHLVILPSSVGIKDTVIDVSTKNSSSTIEQESNFARWLQFFFESR